MYDIYALAKTYRRCAANKIQSRVIWTGNSIIFPLFPSLMFNGLHLIIAISFNIKINNLSFSKFSWHIFERKNPFCTENAEASCLCRRVISFTTLTLSIAELSKCVVFFRKKMKKIHVKEICLQQKIPRFSKCSNRI